MRIGSLVVCVKDSNYLTNDTHPVKGKIYTIRGIVDGKGLTFEEIFNKKQKQPYSVCIEEVSFDINRFKEVVSPMSISIDDFISTSV